jgi:hypothetical protein
MLLAQFIIPWPIAVLLRGEDEGGGDAGIGGEGL